MTSIFHAIRLHHAKFSLLPQVLHGAFGWANTISKAYVLFPRLCIPPSDKMVALSAARLVAATQESTMMAEWPNPEDAWQGTESTSSLGGTTDARTVAVNSITLPKILQQPSQSQSETSCLSTSLTNLQSGGRVFLRRLACLAYIYMLYIRETHVHLQDHSFAILMAVLVLPLQVSWKLPS